MNCFPFRFRRTLAIGAIRFAAYLIVPANAEAIPSPAPMHGVEVQLNGDVKVAAEQVVLGDVATIYAKDVQSFKALSALVISRIPDDKLEVRLPASYLEARVRAALPAGTDFALRAPELVVFHLQRLGISSQEFTAEVERMAVAGAKVPNGSDVDVEAISGIDQLKGMTLANARIEPQAEMEQWKGDLSFKVSRTDSAGAPVWVRARVRVFRSAWVAARSVAFNEAPSPDQFTLGRVETTALREDPVVASPEQLGALLAGAKFKRTLAANAPLMPSAIERKPDAQSGANLRVVFVGESGVRVSADGILVGPGTIGSDVKARLKSSKKLVAGKLVSQGLVEVSL